MAPISDAARAERLVTKCGSSRPPGKSFCEATEEWRSWHDGVKIFIPASTWLAIHGPDKTIAAKNLRAAGVLQPGDGGNMMVKAPRAIPGRRRVYSLRLDKVMPSVGSGGTARETVGSDLAA